MELTPEEKQKIYEEEKARLDAQYKIKAEKAEKIDLGFIAYLVIFIFIGVSIYFTVKPPAPVDNKAKAYTACQQHVDKRLKAPATAKYPPISEATVTEFSDGKYFIIQSYVDAQNGFGALIRTNYICSIKYLGNNQWQLDDLTMD